MNLLTSYLDRKYSRIKKFQRHTTILDPTFHEFYFSIKTKSGKEYMVVPEVPTDIPFIFINPECIEVAEPSFRDTLRKIQLNPLLYVDESTKLNPISEYKPILKGKTPQDIPLICISMNDYVTLMSNLPEMEEDEGDETFEFI